ncbi:Hint domain-containing protein [Anianabacter salinae]|uniref:Hint domain-containing protein n=1 Tax=Anianabacter salinae TaxID=2851023 RepID=UPI00225E0D94|nr:Hint domain-containing protein [Anianabacter salinae]MBV0913386.1 Hint domain-containing protein [Anianabacter salinae]
MNWIGLRFDEQIMRLPQAVDAFGQIRLATGSIVLELDTAELDAPFVDLLDYRDPVDWAHSIRVRLATSGHLSVEFQDGPHSFGAELSFSPLDEPTTVRVTLAWDCQHARGYIGLCLPALGRWHDTEMTPTFAPAYADLAAMLDSNVHWGIHPAVQLVGLSRAMEPIGVLPGICAGTPVATARGPVPIEDIVRGDLVMTAEHGLQPVRCAVARVLPTFGWCAPVLVPAPNFGLTRNMLVMPEHRFLIDSAESEYLFGIARVLVRADMLRGISLGRPPVAARTASYHQLVFDRHELIGTAGCWTESLFTGELGGTEQRLRNTVLDPARVGPVPIHKEMASPCLKDFEASVLVAEMCA